MTDNNHPITPPPELVRKWATASSRTHGENGTYAQLEFALATQAARWGADMELEACCAWLSDHNWRSVKPALRAARRPKPPSLKEQALDRCNDYIDPDGIIRRALESLPN